MIGLYFSGTGNTKHCVELLVGLLDPSASAIPLESAEATEAVLENGTVVLGYPVQFSNLPYIVREFIEGNRSLWKGKKVFCVATMGAFSGDGAGCSARILKKHGAVILGGLHLKMPDSVCDSKLLKRSVEQNRALIEAADAKIRQAAAQIRNGTAPKEGLSPFSHLLGLFGQRLWFYKRTAGYASKLKIGDDCTGCGLCVTLCPTGNLAVQNGKAVGDGKCTMCYRCISRCPQKSITLLGDKVAEQCRYEKYAGQN